MKNVWIKNKMLHLCLCVLIFLPGLTVFSAPVPVLESTMEAKNVVQTKKQSKLKTKLERKFKRVKKKLQKLANPDKLNQRSKILLIISLIFLLLGIILLASLGSASVGCFGALISLIAGIGFIIGGITMLIIALV